MSIMGEVDSLDRMIEEAPRNLDELEELLVSIAPGATLGDPGVFDAIPNNYMPSCKEYCPLAAHCRQQAIAAGDPVLLGAGAREGLAAAGSIGRALELLNGAGPAPRTRAAEFLQEELQEAEEAFQEALGYGT